MISQSESFVSTPAQAAVPTNVCRAISVSVADTNVLSAPLMGQEERAVSRLEFHSINQHAIAMKVETDVQRSTEGRLKDKLDALNSKLQSDAEEMPAHLDEVRRSTREESNREWEQRLEEAIAEERARIVEVADKFSRERSRYFAAVEAEVVKLSLAIAGRVLHRETKLDPLLLAGVVRVALAKIAEDSASVLRVPKADLEAWRAMIPAAQHPELQLVGDEVLQAGECVLDTNVGRVELGIGAQLQEIEKGFFDLLQQRPS